MTCEEADPYHIAVWEQLIERLASFLDLHRHRDPLLLRQRAVIPLHLLDHFHLLLCISALEEEKKQLLVTFRLL